MTEDFAKLPLETVLSHWTYARVLDHLVTMKPFDFTIQELMEILQLRMESVESTLQHLMKYDLVEKIQGANGKGIAYRLAENPRTLALHDFMHQTAIYYLEKCAEKKT